MEIVTPERMFSPEIGGLNLTGYIKALQPLDVTFTVMRRLLSVAPAGNGLQATIGSDHGPAVTTSEVDQVMVEHGTVPLDQLYFDLKGQSSNLGAVDYEALVAGRPHGLAPNPEGMFQLFRIGDAVSCRNIHAAIYDSLRLVKDL